MRYREATLADASAIANLHAESWRNTYRGSFSDTYLDGPVYEDRKNVWLERLTTPADNQFVVLAEDADAVVGFACAYGMDDEQLGTLLDNLHVLLDQQGAGIGKRLVLEVARWSHEHYPEGGLYLGVLELNTNAQQFYQRLGAADVGGEVITPTGGGETRSRTYAWTPQQVAELARTTE